VQDLRAWVTGAALPEGHPFRLIKAHPLGPTSPELWILGSSDYGAQLAAHFGLPYAFAYFFTEGRGVEAALDLYRRNYRPSERYPTPQATICVWALAASTEAEARHLLMTREYWRIGFEQGIRKALVTPEEAAAHPYTQAEWATIEAIAATGCIDTWILFPFAANRLMTRSPADIPAAWRDRLQMLFGTKDWESRFYKERTLVDIFSGDMTVIQKHLTMQGLGAYYGERLRTVFPVVAPHPRVLHSDSNRPLLPLFFAAAHPGRGGEIALKIAKYFLD